MGDTPILLTRIIAAEQELIWLDHNVTLKTFYNHSNIYIYLKTLLLEAVDKCWLNKLQNRYTGYLGTTKLELIHHLIDLCDKIMPINIKGKSIICMNPSTLSNQSMPASI